MIYEAWTSHVCQYDISITMSILYFYLYRFYISTPERLYTSLPKGTTSSMHNCFVLRCFWTLKPFSGLSEKTLFCMEITRGHSLPLFISIRFVPKSLVRLAPLHPWSTCCYIPTRASKPRQLVPWATWLVIVPRITLTSRRGVRSITSGNAVV